MPKSPKKKSVTPRAPETPKPAPRRAAAPAAAPPAPAAAPPAAAVVPTGLCGPVRAHRMFATPYSCYRVDATSKRQKLEVIALVAKLWLRGYGLAECSREHTPAIVYDVDETLIDGNQRVSGGYRRIREVFDEGRRAGFSTHLVTARPRSSRRDVLELLERERIVVDSSNLWMMDDGEWERNDPRDVKRFKYDSFKKIRKQHGSVVARFGDRLWDICRPDHADTCLRDVQDKECVLFFDPGQGCLCSKMPGS